MSFGVICFGYVVEEVSEEVVFLRGYLSSRGVVCDSVVINGLDVVCVLNNKVFIDGEIMVGVFLSGNFRYKVFNDGLNSIVSSLDQKIIRNFDKFFGVIGM